MSIKIEQVHTDAFDSYDESDRGPFQVRIHIWGWLGYLIYNIKGWHREYRRR